MTGRPWVSGPCADGRCWDCPGHVLTGPAAICAHPCHDNDTAPARED